MTLPHEIIERIIQHADPCDFLYGDPRKPTPAIARTSTVFRSIYLAQHSCFDFGTGFNKTTGRSRMPMGGKAIYQHRNLLHPSNPHPKIGETLAFPNLVCLARFFTHGPGRRTDAATNAALRRITFVRIVYSDFDDPSRNGWYWGTQEYGYEAYAALSANWHRMNLQRVQLVPTNYQVQSSLTTHLMYNIY